MDKLTLAHSYMVEYVKSNGLEVTDLEVRCAFDIAEAMLAENEKRTDKTRPAVIDEFQVDWSQAPDGFNWWAMDRNGYCAWHRLRPELLDEEFYAQRLCDDDELTFKVAPSFNYQGNWKDSLRGRK